VERLGLSSAMWDGLGRASQRLSRTHVIRRTNQPLSATSDAETIDEATGCSLDAAAGHSNNSVAMVR